MRQQVIEATSAGATDFVCVDRRSSASESVLIVVDMDDGSGTVDFEFTPDDCIEDETPLWIQHDVLKDLATSCASSIMVPFQGFRLNVKTYKSGTIRVRVVQGGDHGW